MSVGHAQGYVACSERAVAVGAGPNFIPSVGVSGSRTEYDLLGDGVFLDGADYGGLSDYIENLAREFNLPI